MDLREERVAGVVILAVVGRLDAVTSKMLEDAILKSIQQGDRQLLVDLAGLEYVSSSGLRVFLVAAKKLKEGNGKMALCAMRGPVKQVFDLAGFSSLLSIHDSREEALKTF